MAVVMLTFLSAFLGLVVGVHPVELNISGEVATVELRLDGQSIGLLRGEPWVLAADFGPELSPHELVAIGRDGEGREVARAVQWLNLPRPRNQVELVLDDSTAPPRSASLLWYSADTAAPDGWRLRFDGQPLEVADLQRFELPSYDPATPHFLQAEVRFGARFSHSEIVVGGAAGEQIETELTLVPVDALGKVPTASEMEGWFSVDGRPLEVVSVERSGADIVLVQEATPRLWGKLLRLHKNAMARGASRDVLTRQLASGLHHEDTLRVLLPVAESHAGASLEQFHISHDFSTIEYGPSSSGVVRKRIATPRAEGILATLPYPPEGALRDDAPRRIADAVAVAGQAAAASRRRRAVVLIRGEGTRDLSTHSPAMVQRYLERLQVPLLVWSPEEIQADAWGDVHDISTSQELLRAVLKLRQTLDRQALVWLRGRHLPQAIELSPVAAQRLARIEVSGDRLGDPSLDGGAATPTPEPEIKP
ncbi:MAG: hypothetical protein AAF657_01450 [Acidobacteriota bacterium]